MSESRIVAAALAGVGILLLALAMKLRLPAHLAPLAVLVPTCVLLLLEFRRLWPPRGVSPPLLAERVSQARRTARPADGGVGPHVRELAFVAWLLGLVAMNLLLGAGVAVPLFLLLWLVLESRQGWRVGLAFAAPAALLVDLLLPWGLGLRLPPGLIGVLLRY
jgi:hypothetical protein